MMGCFVKVLKLKRNRCLSWIDIYESRSMKVQKRSPAKSMCQKIRRSRSIAIAIAMLASRQFGLMLSSLQKIHPATAALRLSGLLSQALLYPFVLFGS